MRFYRCREQGSALFLRAPRSRLGTLPWLFYFANANPIGWLARSATRRWDAAEIAGRLRNPDSMMDYGSIIG
jgi:hypothetical protein